MVFQNVADRTDMIIVGVGQNPEIHMTAQRFQFLRKCITLLRKTAAPSAR